MEEKDTYDINRAKHIEQQVERWDLFAKLAPVVFLLACFLLLALGIIAVDIVFYVGLGIFAFTAVIWWFWAIFSIRFLVRLLRRSAVGLVNVKDDLKDIRKTYVDNEQNNTNDRS